MKDKETIRYIQCAKCGGTQGTLVKRGEEYVHMRDIDCRKYKALKRRKERREAILKQTKPVPQKEVSKDEQDT